jgi:prolyl-tRNA synthetase
MSHQFGRTPRDAPGDVELPSHRLMVRSALVRPLGSGIFSLLPLGWRVVRKHDVAGDAAIDTASDGARARCEPTSMR